MASKSVLRHVFFYSLLLGVGTLAFFIFKPFVVTLAIAATFAVICQPLFQALKRILKGWSSIAAGLTIIIVALLILAPLSLIGAKVVQESADLYTRLSEETEALDEDVIVQIENAIEGYIQPYVPSFNMNLPNVLRQSAGLVSVYIGPIFANTLQTIFHFFLGIVAFFFFLRDGERFLRLLVEYSPLRDGEDRRILDRLSIAINSIIKGSLLIAILQGTVSGIGFAIFGLPSATLWGVLAAIGSLIPGAGTAVVIVPAILYLIFTGQNVSAIGLTIWGAIAVGMIDNFVGPFLVGRGVRIHPMFVLFSVIGGIQFFGPLGFILGPLVLSLFFALLDLYKTVEKGTTAS